MFLNIKPLIRHHNCEKSYSNYINEMLFYAIGSEIILIFANKNTQKH